MLSVSDQETYLNNFRENFYSHSTAELIINLFNDSQVKRTLKTFELEISLVKPTKRMSQCSADYHHFTCNCFVF